MERLCSLNQPKGDTFINTGGQGKTGDKARNLHSCSHCNFKAKQRGNWLKHMKLHERRDEEAKFKCRLCSFRSSCSSRVKIHEVNGHFDGSSENTTQKSENAIQKSENAIQKSENTTQKSENSTQKCEYCNYSSPYTTSITKHLIRCHNIQVGPFKSCTICDFKGVTLPILKEHLKKHRRMEDEGQFKCRLCTYRASLKSVCFHERYHHKYQEDPILSPRIFHCTMCNYKAKRISNLNKHMKQHQQTENKGGIKCKICNYLSDSTRSVKLHEKRDHSPHSSEKQVNELGDEILSNMSDNNGNLSVANYTNGDLSFSSDEDSDMSEILLLSDSDEDEI